MARKIRLSAGNFMKGASSPRKGGAGSPGFSLIEILIAIFISAIVSASIYTLYTNFFQTTHRQDLLLETQQNARIGINMMERELINAGYSSGTPNVLTSNTDAGQIEFIYTDPSSPGTRLKVNYKLATVGSVTYLTRKADDVIGGIVGNTENVIPYATTLIFKYYDKDGNEIVLNSLSSQATRNTVRFVDVKLVATVNETDALWTSAFPKTVTLQTHMNLRNLGIGQTASDTTPPATPTGLKVRDPGVCGRLSVQWTRNTEGDLAGYKLYYGTAPGVYTGVMNIPANVLAGSTYTCTQTSSTMTCTIFPTNPALVYTPSTAAAGTGTTYYVALEAYDNSYNYSNKTADVYGNPSPSNSDFAVAGDDSTINPIKPGAPTGFIAADGPADGQVSLSWSFNKAAYPDVVGFRIYRSDSQFASVPIDNSMWIAGEPGSGYPALNQNAVTYTDVGPNLLSCKVYYYAIAAVNCDTTLIPDNGADPASKKYGWTDYAATCGDGSTACTPGTGFASVSGSDSAPPKSTGPAAPTIAARAGWRRVAITLTQPGDLDLDQTCAYMDSSSYPTLNTLTNPAPSASVKCFPTITGIRMSDPYTPPGYNGIFKATDPTDATYYLGRNATTTFWNSSTIAAPSAPTSAPSLADVATYYYRAVSFNRCGKPSSTNTALAVTTLCYEDPPVCPALDPTGYCQPDFNGKPPAVNPASIQVSCCGTDPNARDATTHLYPVSLSWTGISSVASLPSTENNPYDLAGYRVFKSKSSTDWTSAVVLPATQTAPMWGTSLSDTSVSDAETNSDGFGGVYYYRIVTTDCPYEKVNPTVATIKNDMNGTGTVPLQSSISAAVYPGKIDRTKKCAGVGACTKTSPADHREVLTGVDMAGDNSSSAHLDSATSPFTSSFSYSHNTVTMFFNNTAARTMTVTDASVEWINVSAYLTKITIGGGRSGIVATSTSFVNGDTINFTNSPAPFTRGVALHALTNATIPAYSTGEYVPITFEFKDQNGKPIDMRDDSLYITLKAKNDQTGTGSAGCVSYLTISQLQEAGGVYIPLGPQVTSLSRNKPSSPTFDTAIPGPNGTNTVPITGGTDYAPNPVAGSSIVTISANVLSNTINATTGAAVNISSAEIHYVETAITVGTAPALSDLAWSDATKSGVVAMTGAATGGTWTGNIPARVTTGGPKRVWYYVVAFDSDGNYDRLPKTSDGYYVYDQKQASVCDYTPDSTGINLQPYVVDSVGGTYASMKWTRVTKYTDGTVIDPVADPIYYQVWRKITGQNGDLFQMVYKVKDSTPTSCVWILSGGQTYTSPVTAASGVLAPSTSASFAHCAGAPELFYWLEYSTFNTLDVSWYIVPQNSCSANGNAGTASATFRECMGSLSATLQVNPTTIQYGDTNLFTINVSDCALSSNGVANTVSVNLCSQNLNASNCVGNSTYTTPPTYKTTYPIAETGDTGTFKKTDAVASTTNMPLTKVYVNPIGNTTTETDTVYVSCPACSGPPAPVTLTVKSLACDRTPSAPTGVAVTSFGSNNIITWTANTEWDMAAGQTPTAASYTIYRGTASKVGSTYTCPASASFTTTYSVAGGTTSYTDTAMSGSNKYCYFIKATDSCPLTSAASLTVGPM